MTNSREPNSANLSDFEKLDSIERQRIRYDAEALRYDKHHSDPFSQKYRTKFLRDRLFTFNLSGMRVLDAMCASGIETQYLIENDADVIGLDISPNNASTYTKKWGKECTISSIHSTPYASNYFDCIYISGGLHHVIPILYETLREAHRILKPGGYLVFVEPNSDTWLDILRKIWYKLDRRFQDSEEALSYKNHLLEYLSLGIKEQKFFTGGSFAYLFISQSLIFGIPLAIKKILYPLLVACENIADKIPFFPRLYLAAVWQKLP